MNQEIIPTQLYVGRREDLMAELYDGLSIYRGKYLVVPHGEATWDAEGANSLKVVKQLIREAKQAWPNIEVIWI